MDLNNREMAEELIEKTNKLVADRQALLEMQREHMKAKMQLKALDASFMDEITKDTSIKNDRGRDAQLAITQKSSDDYKNWLTVRNQCWVNTQLQEIQIELDNNEIKNLRILLKQ